jgi:hypothetical protein
VTEFTDDLHWIARFGILEYYRLQHDVAEPLDVIFTEPLVA